MEWKRKHRGVCAVTKKVAERGITAEGSAGEEAAGMGAGLNPLPLLAAGSASRCPGNREGCWGGPGMQDKTSGLQAS